MERDMRRCGWVNEDPVMQAYHDHEWGTPVHDERLHFEFLVLETMQAGLSWSIVLKKRERFREVLFDFQPEEVARIDDDYIEKLLQDPGIIRNGRKLRAAVNNAQMFLKIQLEFGSFDRYIWGFVQGIPVMHDIRHVSDLPVSSELSDRVSADLKRRGFSFVGTTIIYAHLQAIGVINDHEIGCFRRAELLGISNSTGS